MAAVEVTSALRVGDGCGCDVSIFWAFAFSAGMAVLGSMGEAVAYSFFAAWDCGSRGAKGGAVGAVLFGFVESFFGVGKFDAEFVELVLQGSIVEGGSGLGTVGCCRWFRLDEIGRAHV